jgi:hypothetical protein
MIDSGIKLYAVKGLHTKLYLFDKSDGVLGSANFTAGGFISNVELSLHVEDENELIFNLYNYFIYMAALTVDKRNKAQPVIIGRGRLQEFSIENCIDDIWVAEYTWTDRYPWYCVIKEMSLLNTEVKNGVPLDEVLGELGSDTYVSSFGKNESVSDVSKKHYQKAHIRLTGNAKDFIDKTLDKLEYKYGVETYYSEVE